MGTSYFIYRADDNAKKIKNTQADHLELTSSNRPRQLLRRRLRQRQRAAVHRRVTWLIWTSRAQFHLEKFSVFFSVSCLAGDAPIWSARWVTLLRFLHRARYSVLSNLDVLRGTTVMRNDLSVDLLILSTARQAYGFTFE